MHEGQITGVLERADCSEGNIMQLAVGKQIAAAQMLADAHCDVICWIGASASWLGWDHDRTLCAAIREQTGIPACSAVLALEEVFRANSIARFGLVTPYVAEVQARILANFALAGFTCSAERSRGLSVNYDFAALDADAICAMVREVARSQPDAITILCTNMRGAPLAESLETELGMPVYDSVAVAVWASLRCAGIAPSRVQGWGRLFKERADSNAKKATK